jgi:DnaK suppressor protein
MVDSDMTTVDGIDVLRMERRRLLSEIEHLRQTLSSEVDPTEEEADPEIVEREKALVVLRTLERKVDEVDVALRHAERGTYGICEVCGEPIDPERLAIMPEATMCVPCKSGVERRGTR